MYTSDLTLEDQYKLVMECRQSGLTDLQWCDDHNIKLGTFYYWLKCLKRAGKRDIPNTKHLCAEVETTVKQEVVKLSFNKPVVPNDISEELSKASSLEILFHDACVRITNDTDLNLLSQTLRGLKECL